MSILDRDVFNEYNLNYDPVGLRNIALPDSFFTKAFAPELNLEQLQELQNKQALNRAGIMAIDNAGLVTPAYEDFAQVAKPGFNLDFAKQLGKRLGTGFITAFNPFVGAMTGLANFANRAGITGALNTFRQSDTLAEFARNIAQERRDKRAREDAARRGAAKQRAKALDYEYDAYGGGKSTNDSTTEGRAPEGFDEL